jgi:hypothetical protein
MTAYPFEVYAPKQGNEPDQELRIRTSCKAANAWLDRLRKPGFCEASEQGYQCWLDRLKKRLAWSKKTVRSCFLLTFGRKSEQMTFEHVRKSI